MTELSTNDHSWIVALPDNEDEYEVIISRFEDIGADVSTLGNHSDDWCFLGNSVNHQMARYKSFCGRKRVSVEEAIQLLTTGALPMTEEVKKSPKADKLVEVYVKMRNKKAELTRECKDAVGLIDEQMKKIATALDGIMFEVGTDSFKTAAGTAFKATKDFVGVDEIEDFREFMALEAAGGDKELAAKINNAFPWHFLTKAVSKPAVVQFIKDNDGLAPAGLKYTKLLEVQVRAK